MPKKKNAVPAALAALALLIPALPAQAADIDFSCMSYKVWGKGYVSDQFMDFDIVMQNRCPGAVYWAMCIERVDPWTGKILETHTPTGYLEKDKKSRVNLHLSKGSEQPRFRNRFQEFYVDIGYAVGEAASSACHAKSCEARKRDIRAELRANDKAWQTSQSKISARIRDECPDIGWDKTGHEECKSRVLAESDLDMQVFALEDRELREKMAGIDPEKCKVWSGNLTSR